MCTYVRAEAVPTPEPYVRYVRLLRMGMCTYVRLSALWNNVCASKCAYVRTMCAVMCAWLAGPSLLPVLLSQRAAAPAVAARVKQSRRSTDYSAHNPTNWFAHKFGHMPRTCQRTYVRTYRAHTPPTNAAHNPERDCRNEPSVVMVGT